MIPNSEAAIYLLDILWMVASGLKRGYVCKRLEKWRGPLKPLCPLHEGVSIFLHCIGVIKA